MHAIACMLYLPYLHASGKDSEGWGLPSGNFCPTFASGQDSEKWMLYAFGLLHETTVSQDIFLGTGLKKIDSREIHPRPISAEAVFFSSGRSFVVNTQL